MRKGDTTMTRHAPAVEWTFCDSEQDWQTARTASRPTSAAPQRTVRSSGYGRRWAATSLLLLLAALVVCLGVRQMGRQRLAQDRAELQTALHLEQWAVAQDDPALARLSLDPDALPRPELYDAEFDRLINANPAGAAPTLPAVALNVVDTWGDVTVVAVRFTPGAGPAFRQTRFYRRTDAGWLRSAPDPTLWGLPRTLETERLIFHYRERDLPVVAAVAETADALAATVERAFGLAAGKLAVTVSVDAPPFTVAPDGEAVRLASPAAYLAPATIDDATLLEQALALALMQRAVQLTARPTPAGAQWQPLVEAIGLWQLWQLDLPLAGWQEPLVRRIYAGEKEVSVEAGDLATDLCAAHRVWLEEPATLRLPVACQPPVLLGRGPVPPAALAELTPTPWELSSRLGVSGEGLHPDYGVALATVVDYLAATYGAERLPDLVAALEDHATWDSLTAAVYGVAAADIQSGWRAHLHGRYGVDCAR